MAVYTLQEASDIVGLTVGTLRSYTTKRQSTLVRGVDFFVRRPSRYRKQAMLTEQGIRRLLARDYHAWNGNRRLKSGGQRERADLARLVARVGFIDKSASEQRALLKQAIELAARAYLQHPCAVPSCPCSFHTLGAPQADRVREIMTRAPGVHPNGTGTVRRDLPPL